MSAPKPITIVGGGLAGLTLGIGLRQRGVPVTVVEAGRYPRHRVCGEFISGRGQETLERLGLREILLRAGARPATTAAFFSTRSSGPVRELPAPALCLSRHVLDARLARRFRELGGELRENERQTEPHLGEGMVRASGRRAQPAEGRWRWFGLKVHARGVVLQADLEMHLQPGGYVGLCQLKDQAVNVCGLFRRRIVAEDATRDWRQRLRGSEGSPLRQRMANAKLDESTFRAVAGLSLRPRRGEGRDECCLGDALTMIPPVTGNGMSLAFESAEIAVEPLGAYARGATSWAEAQRLIARRCDAAFARRLAWAGWLHRAIFATALQEALVCLVPCQPWLWRMIFAKTR